MNHPLFQLLNTTRLALSPHFHGFYEWLYAQIAPDGGPIYAETDFSQTIVEPFNAVSAFLFLIVVVYFAQRFSRRGNWREHRFVAASLPFLAIGGLGGTLYHAFRMSKAFLLMDWLPIAILTLAAGIYFLSFLVKPRWWALVIVLGIMAGQMLFFKLVASGTLPINRHMAINTNYAVMAIAVALPILLYLRKRDWVHTRLFVLAVLSFAGAWVFRMLDSAEGMPSPGTHWLWHLFGAVATLLVIELVYKLKPEQNGVQLHRSVSS